MSTHDVALMAYLCDVAKALDGLTQRDVGYGMAYVTEVLFSVDGDEIGLSLVANDQGSLDVEIGVPNGSDR